MSDTFRADCAGEELPVKHWPPWREGLRRFLADGFKYGDVVPGSWFYEAFGIEEPKGKSWEEGERLQLKKFRQLDLLRDELLQCHKILLVSEGNGAYRLVPPQEQTELACKQLEHELRKGLKRALLRLVHTNTEGFSSDQQAGVVAAQAKTTMLLGMMTRTRLLEREK